MTPLRPRLTSGGARGAGCRGNQPRPAGPHGAAPAVPFPGCCRQRPPQRITPLPPPIPTSEALRCALNAPGRAPDVRKAWRCPAGSPLSTQTGPETGGAGYLPPPPPGPRRAAPRNPGCGRRDPPGLATGERSRRGTAPRVTSSVTATVQTYRASQGRYRGCFRRKK